MSQLRNENEGKASTDAAYTCKIAYTNCIF